MRKSDYAKMFNLRKDGRYQGRYKDENGKVHVVCDKDPERLFNRLEDYKKPKQVLFSEIAEAWKEYHWERIEGGTRTCYNPAYKRAIEFFGEREAIEIVTRDVYTLLCNLNQKGYSSKTIKTQKTVIKLIYDYATCNEKYYNKVKDNPAAGCPLPKAMKRPEKVEAPEELVVKRIRKNWREYRFGFYALLLINTGLRRGEALGLRWEDIDFKEGIIKVQNVVKYNGALEEGKPKTDAGYREIPLFQELRRSLIEIRPEDYKMTDYIVHGQDPSKPLSESSFKRCWCNFKKDSNNDTLTSHPLRHAFATTLFEQGVDEYTAQNLMGHADIETTHRIYTHLRQKQKKKSLKKLEKYFA